MSGLSAPLHWKKTRGKRKEAGSSRRAPGELAFPSSDLSLWSLLGGVMSFLWALEFCPFLPLTKGKRKWDEGGNIGVICEVQVWWLMSYHGYYCSSVTDGDLACIQSLRTESGGEWPISLSYLAQYSVCHSFPLPYIIQASLLPSPCSEVTVVWRQSAVHILQSSSLFWFMASLWGIQFLRSSWTKAIKICFLAGVQSAGMSIVFFLCILSKDGNIL